MLKHVVIFGLSFCVCQSAYGQQAGAEPNAIPELHLACDGTGTYPGDDYTRTIATEVFVDVVDGGGRIKVPTVMVPPMHNGPADSWRAFDKLTIEGDAIKAKFTLNMFNKPRVSIDRMTGHIDVTGSFDFTFTGQCRPYQAQKLF